MAVPPVSDFIHPALEALAGGGELSVAEVDELVAWHFGLTPEERRAMTRGGSDTQVRSRTSWALTLLFQAGLAERPKRKHYRVTPLGEETLRALGPGERVDRAFLERYEGYRAFKDRTGTRGGSPDGAHRRHRARPAASAAVDASPAGAVARAAATARQALVAELAGELADAPPQLLAGLVARLLAALGYAPGAEAVERALVARRDGGALEAEFWTDPLEFSRVHLRVHPGRQPVGPEAVHDMLRALQTRQGRYGIVVGTGGFTEDAARTLDLTDRRLTPVTLVDAERLARLLVAQGIGVVERTAHRVQELDPAFFPADDEDEPGDVEADA